MKTTLTPEQSATLIAKGISADKASMCQLYSDYDGEIIDPSEVFEDCGILLAVVNDEAIEVDRNIVPKDSDFDHSFADDTPIFTLADICALLPKEIEIDTHRCGLNMWYHNAHYWMVSYVQFDGAEIAYQSPVVSRDRLIDALYEFLCMCIRNGHIDFTK